MKKIILLLIVILIVAGLGFLYYSINEVTTVGFLTIKESNLLEENDKYYLFIEGKKMEVSEKHFNEIQVGKNYDFKFTWNRLLKEKGKIEKLELDPSFKD